MNGTDVSFYLERTGSHYEAYWRKQLEELTGERATVLAELAAHAAQKP